MNSSGAVFEALKTLWDSKSDLSVLAGPYADMAPDGTTIPYVVVTSVSNERIGRSNASKFWRHVVRFTVYDRSKALVESHIALINDQLAQSLPALDTGHLLSHDESLESYDQPDERLNRAFVERELVRRVPLPA